MSSWPCFERQSRRLAQWLVAPQRVASGGAVCSQRVRCQTGQLRRNVRGWAWVRCGDRICWQVGRGDAKSLPASAAMCACGFSLSARTFQRAFRCQSCVREIGFVSCDVRARARDRDGAPQAAAVLVVDIRGVRARVRAARDAEPPRLQRAALGASSFQQYGPVEASFHCSPSSRDAGHRGAAPRSDGRHADVLSCYCFLWCECGWCCVCRAGRVRDGSVAKHSAFAWRIRWYGVCDVVAHAV